MNNKELLIDFIEYAKSRHVMPILHFNIEPLVDDYLRQQNLQQYVVSGSLPLTNGQKLINAIQTLVDLGAWEEWKYNNPDLLKKLQKLISDDDR